MNEKKQNFKTHAERFLYITERVNQVVFYCFGMFPATTTKMTTMMIVLLHGRAAGGGLGLWIHILASCLEETNGKLSSSFHQKTRPECCLDQPSPPPWEPLDKRVRSRMLEEFMQLFLCKINILLLCVARVLFEQEWMVAWMDG